MARISRLPNIDPTVVATLKRKKVITVAELWEAIGADFPEGIKRVAVTTRVEAQLREILKQEAAADNPGSNSLSDRLLFFVGRYWREVLALVIGVVLLSLLIWHVVRRPDALVVTGPNRLPAFHIIQAGDVRPKKMFWVQGSLAVESDAIGRYLMQPVSPGAVLLNSQLGPPQLKEQLNGRQVLTIPIKIAAISPTIQSATSVRLLFSPRNSDVSKTSKNDLILEDVIVLAVNRQGDSSSITVALKNKDDLARAASLLSTSDIFISEG